MKTVLIIILLCRIAYAQPCDALTGTASQGTIEYTLNPFKNRTHAPTSSQIVNTITLDKILQTGNDLNRFHNSEGAVIEGYVISTKLSDKESCNCDMTAPKFRDIHLMIAKNANETDKAKMMVIEITPKIRATKPTAWSPANISKLVGHKIKITGWMMFDTVHKNVARNTAASSTTSYQRATCWEVHPVTHIVTIN